MWYILIWCLLLVWCLNLILSCCAVLMFVHSSLLFILICYCDTFIWMWSVTAIQYYLLLTDDSRYCHYSTIWLTWYADDEAIAKLLSIFLSADVQYSLDDMISLLPLSRYCHLYCWYISDLLVRYSRYIILVTDSWLYSTLSLILVLSVFSYSYYAYRWWNLIVDTHWSIRYNSLFILHYHLMMILRRRYSLVSYGSMPFVFINRLLEIFWCWPHFHSVHSCLLVFVINLKAGVIWPAGWRLAVAGAGSYGYLRMRGWRRRLQ